MSSSSIIPSDQVEEGNRLAIKMPELGTLKAFALDLKNVVEADRTETKLMVRDVTPSTFSHLEHVYGEAYRDLKKHLAIVGGQLLEAQENVDKIKAGLILDKFPEFLKGKPKSMDNAATRDAFITQDPEYQAMKDRMNTLKTIEVFLEGRVKVMERATSYMRKKMDMFMRSGASLDGIFDTIK